MKEVKDDSRRIFTSRARYSCGAAAEAFRTALSAIDADEQPQDPDSGVVQKQRFRRWCDSEKINHGDFEFERTRVGQEHFVVELDHYYIKITLPSQAGYHVTIDPFDGIDFTNSLPLDYLERQANQTAVFGVPCDFLGIVGHPHRFQMVTRQVRVLGEPAPFEAIDEMMLDLGFQLLPQHFAKGDLSSHSFFNDEFAVFDLRPANVVQTSNGLCIPIDCFVTQLDHARYEFLLTL